MSKAEEITNLMKVLDILCNARNNLDLQAYIRIWGKDLGEHIWRQEGSDLLKVWRSGLTHNQANAFATWIVYVYGDKK